MQLGVFAKTFPRDSIEANLDAVRKCGFGLTQYNLSCAGLPTLPDLVSHTLRERINVAHRERGLSMAAISGTFNIIDPDREQLAANLRRLRVLAEAASSLGTNVITLCTGTRNPRDMWRWHPENETASAWQELLKSAQKIADIAESTGVYMAFEPEANNVVNSARKARRLLDEVSSPWLKVILDAANLGWPNRTGDWQDVLDEAFALLIRDTVVCHLKEVFPPGQPQQGPIGSGLLDVEGYLRGLIENGFEGPLIMHGLCEEHIPASLDFLRDALTRNDRMMV